MSVVTKATLKTYFETGDTPTQAQFVDLVDSLVVHASNQTTTALDTINESTSGNGVSIDSVKCLDGLVELTQFAGVQTASGSTKNKLYYDTTNVAAVMSDNSGNYRKLTQDICVSIFVDTPVAGEEYPIFVADRDCTMVYFKAIQNAAGATVSYKLSKNASGTTSDLTAAITSAMETTTGGSLDTTSETFSATSVSAGDLVYITITDATNLTDVSFMVRYRETFSS